MGIFTSFLNIIVNGIYEWIKMSWWFFKWR